MVIYYENMSGIGFAPDFIDKTIVEKLAFVFQTVVGFGAD